MQTRKLGQSGLSVSVVGIGCNNFGRRIHDVAEGPPVLGAGHELQDVHEQARALAQKLQEVLNSQAHRWFLNKMDPQETRRREKARQEFLKRYQK